MVKSLEKIVSKVIIPKFPEIKTFWVEEVNRFTPLSTTNYRQPNAYNHYVVKYGLSRALTRKQESELESETETLFKMLGPNKSDVVSVVTYYDFSKP